VELLVVLIIAATMTAIAAPVIQGALSNIHLSSAVQSTTSAISTTRYQALRYGYPFQLQLNAATLKYQVLSEPVGAAAFSNVGSAIPISASNVALNANTTLQFNPSGTVQFIAGAAGFSLDGQTYTISFAGKTTTVTVSSVGYVTTSTQ
jgi:Tfp pilus assembly protein FimT